MYLTGQQLRHVGLAFELGDPLCAACLKEFREIHCLSRQKALLKAVVVGWLKHEVSHTWTWFVQNVSNVMSRWTFDCLKFWTDQSNFYVIPPATNCWNATCRRNLANHSVAIWLIAIICAHVLILNPSANLAGSPVRSFLFIFNKSISWLDIHNETRIWCFTCLCVYAHTYINV